MAFVAVLMISIALFTIYIGNTYNKGITLRQVNEAGTEISNDIQRSIATASELSTTDGSESYVELATGGRLCMGQYSYVWNFGKFLDGPIVELSNHYIWAGPGAEPRISFVKVFDGGKLLCKDTGTGAPGVPVYPNVEHADATEMLATGDRNLALHNFAITSDGQSGLYAITLSIGTNDSLVLESDYGSCKPPSDAQGLEDYCSVNKFDIVARVGSSGE